MAAPLILIVDDEPYNVDYLEQELDDLGFLTASAGNGQQALAQVQAAAPDVILLDIMMPVMDGFETLTRLKGDPATRAIPVIIISAANDLPRVARGIELGAEDYLPKPFEPTLLKARLANALEKKRLRDAEQLYLRALEREFAIGREIQAGFLPAALPGLPGWQLAVHFQAARQVGGDFYDAFLTDGGRRVGLLLGDVCDKGIGAALFMTLFRSLLRAGAEPDFFAGEAAGRLNETQRLLASARFTNNYIARMHGSTSMFATVFFALLDPATGDLAYLNAGHQPPLLFAPGGLRQRLPRTGPPLGVAAEAVFGVEHVRLEPGDTLLILTDGVTDATDAGEQEFGEDRVLAAAEQHRADPPGQLLAGLAAAAAAHIGAAPQYDDVTLLAVRRQA